MARKMLESCVLRSVSCAALAAGNLQCRGSPCIEPQQRGCGKPVPSPTSPKCLKSLPGAGGCDAEPAGMLSPVGAQWEALKITWVCPKWTCVALYQQWDPVPRVSWLRLPSCRIAVLWVLAAQPCGGVSNVQKGEAGRYSQSWGLLSVCLEVVGSSSLLIYYPRRKKCCMRVSISSCYSWAVDDFSLAGHKGRAIFSPLWLSGPFTRGSYKSKHSYHLPVPTSLLLSIPKLLG